MKAMITTSRGLSHAICPSETTESNGMRERLQDTLL